MSSNQKKLSVSHPDLFRSLPATGFGEVTYRSGACLGPRWQSNFQLVVLQRGSVSILIDGRPISVPSGMGILLAPGHVEEFHFSQAIEARHSWCQISPDDLPDGLAFSKTAFYRVAPCPPDTTQVIRMGLRIPPVVSEQATDCRRASAMVIAAIWSFVATLVDGGKAKTPSLNITALGKFSAVLAELGPHTVNLDNLARASGVSRGHLIKLVRTHLDTTPMEMVWRTRVNRGAKLLCETGLSVAEVADQTGFANAHHFSRRFKTQFGLPPRLWRIRNWSSP